MQSVATTIPYRHLLGAGESCGSGCKRGARYLVHPDDLTPTRDDFTPFNSRLECLNWIMLRRSDLTRALPGAMVRAVRLDRWLLGLE